MKKYNCHFLLLGGGGFSENTKDLRIESFGLKLTHRDCPRICFIPTASADNESYIHKFYRAFASLSCQPFHLTLTPPNVENIQEFLNSMDAFYIGGGITRNLLALWKTWKIDEFFLNELIFKNVVIFGISAGALIWFDRGLTDSNPYSMEFIEGLKVISGAFTPHYNQDLRKQKWAEALFEKNESKYAVEDDVFMHFHQNSLKGVYSTRKNGYILEKDAKVQAQYLINKQTSLNFIDKKEKYILAPYVRTGVKDGVLRCGFGSLGQLVSDPTERKICLSSMNYMTAPHTIVELQAYLNSQFHEDRDINNQTIHRLITGNYLIPETGFNQLDRFSRHYLYYYLSGANASEVQQKLAEASVAILGCGGIGNLVAVTLATLGVQKITLVDGDIIEESNLGRQIMFTQKDIGPKKVEVLKKSLLERNPDLSVETIAGSVQDFLESKKKKPSHLFILSADSTGLIHEVNRYCVKNDQPFINIGYIADIALFGPLVIPGVTGCFSCQRFIVDNENIPEKEMMQIKKINERSSNPSIGPINMLSASLGLIEILRFLGEIGQLQTTKARIGCWTDRLEFEFQTMNKNPHCSVCALGCHQTVLTDSR